MASSTSSPTSSASSLSDATATQDIKDKWEILFVYGFIVRFTSLTSSRKHSPLNSAMDLENALLSDGSTPVMVRILETFVRNLWRRKDGKKDIDTSPQHIERALSAVIAQYATNSKERTVWWSFSKHQNASPFLSAAAERTPGFFFRTDADTKLKALRQLVEWQLMHCESIKNLIDDSWGVKHKGPARRKAAKGTETKAATGLASANAAGNVLVNKEELEIVPLGTDVNRKRYWVVDDSPRVWVSGNPWKKNCPFEPVSSTRCELDDLISSLKRDQPPIGPEAARNKFVVHHDTLLSCLEARLPQIDTELERIQRVLKRQADKEAADARLILLAAQRETRTRVRARVDYAAVERGTTVGVSDDESEDDGGNVSDSSAYDDDTQRRPRATKSRTTTRASRQTTSASASRASSSAVEGLSRKRKAVDNQEWRGERRSSRLTGQRYQIDLDNQTTEDDFDTPFSDQEVIAPGKSRAKKQRIMSPSAEAPLAATQRPRKKIHQLHSDHNSMSTPSLLSDRQGPLDADAWDSSSLSSVPDDDDDGMC